jgi:membrane associated rhomboid family serine protease
MELKRIFRSKRIQIIFLIAGAISGFLYWRFVGCTSGTCAIKSVWYWTTLWGAAMGYLVGDFISDIIQKRKKDREESK